MAYVKNTTFLNRPKKNFMKEFLPIKTLNPSAKIIFMYIVSKPDEWHLNYTDISNNTAINRSTVTDNMKHLVNHGYISMSSKGLETYYSINCYPETEPKTPITCTEFTHTEKPHTRKSTKTDSNKAITKSTSYTEKPHTEKPHDINIDNRNIDIRIDNKDINKKINNKKESEVNNDMDKKKQLVKRLNSLGIDNTDNLFKYNSLDEIEQQIKWLPYRISINTDTEDQIKYKLIDSIRYKEGTPKELKDIELTDKLKLACRLIKTNGTSKGDMIQALIKKLVKMKELHSKKLDIHIKETIELETLQRNLLKQAPLTVKEKGEIQEKETEIFEQHKQNISNELKILRDSLDIKELFKSSLDTLNSQEGLKILLDKEIMLYGSLDSLFNRLETFILKETYKECA